MDTKKISIWIGIAAGLVTIVSVPFVILPYFQSPTRNDPPPHSFQSNTIPEIDRENEIGSEENDIAVVPAQPFQSIALGYDVEQLRKANEVRTMMPLEQGQELSGLSGIYGFVEYFRLGGVFGPYGEIDFSVQRERDSQGVEVHKTPAGDVMLLIYVDESTAVRLANPHAGVGSIFGFWRPVDGHSALVGLPIGRILDWEHRESGENGFAEILVD